MRNLVWLILPILMLCCRSALAADTSLSLVKSVIDRERIELTQKTYPEVILRRSTTGLFTLGGIAIKETTAPIMQLLNEQEIRRSHSDNHLTRGPSSTSESDSSHNFSREMNGGGPGASGKISSPAIVSRPTAPFAIKKEDNPPSRENKVRKSRSPVFSARVTVENRSEVVSSDVSNDLVKGIFIADENFTPTPNLVPVLESETFATPLDMPISLNIELDLLANDRDPEGVTLKLNSIDLNSELSGHIVDNGDGTITYTPPVGVIGDDRFVYWVTDGVNIESSSVSIKIYHISSIPSREQTVDGVATSTNSISTSAPLAGVVDDLYVATIVHSDSSLVVDTVSGLGLTWELLEAQCSNKSSVSIEVWFALGTPSISEVVSAQLSGVAESSQMSVSRYTNTDSTNPIAFLEKANSIGVGSDCGNAATATKRFDYPINTTVENALIIGVVGYSQINTFTAESFLGVTSISSGANPDATGLIVQELNAPIVKTYSFDGELQNSTLWGAISYQIMPAP